MRFSSRWALAMPPFLLTLAGGTAVIASPFAWGAGSHVELPDWMTTFFGLLFGATAIAIGFVTLRDVLRRTAVAFSTIQIHLPLGVVLVFVAVMLLILTTRIGDPNTYDSLRDSRGEITMSAPAFFITTVLGTAIIAAMASACAYVYSQALSREQSRFTKREGEQDVIGKMLEEQVRDGTKGETAQRPP